MSNSCRIIEELAAGREVKTRLHGNSMSGKIESGSLVTIRPIKIEEVEEGDIVYCKVHGQIYAHLVKALGGGACLISNNKGHINGWTRTVYGKVVSVEK